MPKSSKPPNDATPAEPPIAPPASAEQTAISAASSENPGAKKAAKTARKRMPAAARKSPASAKGRKAPARKKAEPAEFIISDEDIRIRAYFIAQHRALNSLGGDSAGDWIEARRQLFEEAAKSA